VDEEGKPYGIINGFSLFKYFSETLGPRPGETTVREMMSAPCRDAADTTYRSSPVTRISVIRSTVFCGLSMMISGLWMMAVCIRRRPSARYPQPTRDSKSSWWIITSPARRSPRSKKLSCSRSWIITGSETRTRTHLSVLQLTSWIHIHSCIRADGGCRACDASQPGRCASRGLLADTLILTSPPPRRATREQPNGWHAGRSWEGSPLKGETIESYGKAILSAGAGLANRTPGEIVSNDIKPYEAGGFHFAIAQAEVTDLVQLAEHLEPLTKALNDLRDKRGLNSPCCSSRTWSAARAGWWSPPLHLPSWPTCPTHLCQTARVTRLE